MRLFITIALFLLSINSLFAQKAEKISKKVRTSIPLMTEHITRNCTSDLEKVDSIYHWITSNIAYDYKVLESTKPLSFQGSQTTLKSKKAVCNAYVELMRDMLKVSGIQSEYIEGYTRSFEPDYPYTLFESDHAWIAIKLDNEWKLADPTWDAGYIGRIPKKIKPYPKKWDAEDIKEKKKKKYAKKKEAYQKKIDEQDPYTDEIGFVFKPSTDYYLIHSDSFLITHLPTLPEWQLRKFTISIDQFCAKEDSVKMNLDSPVGDTLDFEPMINEYAEKSIIEKWLYTAKQGFDYNELNHGVKAVNNHNTVGVYLDSDFKKLVKKYPNIDARPMWNDLIPLTDTAMVHAKLASKLISVTTKEKLNHHKAIFKEEKNRQKVISKQISTTNKYFEKANKEIVNSNKRIKTDFKSIEEKLLKYAPYVEGKEAKEIDQSNEKLAEIFFSFDTINQKIDSLKNSILAFRENSSLQGVMNGLTEGNYHLLYANAYVSINDIDASKEIENHDTLAINSFKLATRIIIDSLLNEIQSKKYYSAVKQLEKFMKSQKPILRELESDRAIKSASSVERYMMFQVYDRLKEAKQMTRNSNGYNGFLEKNLKIIGKEVKTVSSTNTELAKSRLKRDEAIKEELTKSKERGINLYKLIQENAKKWKTELKKRVG
ncbi:MAG: transglutaminase domain-containing protein [Crocinitomicaceae bacterium]